MAKNVQWQIERKAARRILSQRGVEEMVEENTDAVMSNAEAIARREAYDTGAYADSFSKRMEKGKDGYRPVGVVTTDAPHWVFIEYGTRKLPAKNVIRRAVNKTGLKSGKRRT
jgi:hypothetical protein